jgi:hypothetical protein
VSSPAARFTNATWLCASTDNGDCIELAATAGDAAVRDSKNRSGRLIVVPRPAIDRVLAAAKAGLLDEIIA